MNVRLAALLLAVVVFPATGAPRAAAAADANTVVISQGVDPDTLDPLKTTVTPTFNVIDQMYDRLTNHDAAGKLIPNLAVSWKQIEPSVWEFKLRHNVKFWNGDPFTSADVKFTIEKIKDPAYKSTQGSRVTTIDHVETPDPYTVRYVTKRPAAIIPGRPWAVRIVDAKYWKEHGDAYMAEHPMGTGPFVFRHWKKDDEIAMDANPSYWAGSASIGHVVFKPIPEAAARVAALKTGATDLITNVPFQYALSLSGGRNTRMASARSLRILYIAFNTLTPGPQQNKLVRQAFNYGVDVPAVIKSVLGGRAYEAATPLPPGFFGYDAKIPLYRHDAAKAKALLAKAGYPDGKGLEMVLNAPVGRYNKDKEIAEAIGGQLSALGAKIIVKTQEWTNYSNLVNNRGLSPMYELGWSNDTYDADDTIYSLLSGGGRISTFANPEVDRLVEQGRYELNPAKRSQIYAKAFEIIHDEAPWIFLFQYEDLYATSRRLQFQPRPDEQLFVYEMKLQR